MLLVVLGGLLLKGLYLPINTYYAALVIDSWLIALLYIKIHFIAIRVYSAVGHLKSPCSQQPIGGINETLK